MADPTAPASMHEQADAAEAPRAAEPPPGTEPARPGDGLVLDELLVEDVSIDGMCGVY
jgi:mycofactocin precursor